VARYYDPLGRKKQQYKPIVSAADFADANGVTVLSYTQAQAAARKWFEDVHGEETGETVGPVTVRQAVAEYLEDRRRAGTKTARRMEWDFNAHILPDLGDVALSRMNRKRIKDWMWALAGSGKRRRGGKVDPPPGDDAAKLARKSTANRIWTMLRAALNLASEAHGIKPIWEDVKAFGGADSARARFLNEKDSSALAEACTPPDFRRLVEAALHTGAREGELARATVGDFDGARLWIAPGKTGKGRWIVLEDSARPWFAGLCLDKETGDPLFPRETTGTKRCDYWQSKAVMMALRSACEKADITPLLFHELRHTYASRLVNRGVPLVFIAAQLGHANTRMVEKHYGHLCDAARERAIRGEVMPRPATLESIQP
jgi:integrase